MYDYHIHSVLLDYSLQMTVVMATRDRKNRGKTGVSSKIGKLTVSKNLEEEMNIHKGHQMLRKLL